MNYQADETMAAIAEYVQQFETGGQAYRNLPEKYVHFLFRRMESLEKIIAGRDAKIIELIRENGNLKAGDKQNGRK